MKEIMIFLGCIALALLTECYQTAKAHAPPPACHVDCMKIIDRLGNWKSRSQRMRLEEYFKAWCLPHKGENK